MKITKRTIFTTVSLGTIASLAGQGKSLSAQTQTQRTTSPSVAVQEHSGTMQRSDRDMRRVVEKLQQLGAKPIGTQSVEETRKGPTPADAIKAILKDDGKDPQALIAQMRVKMQDVSYPTAGGTQAARIYTPETQAGPQQPLPVIVYYHGGGWVIADIATYESSAMALAHKAKAIVVSVEYRHAPEHKFPAAHEDAFNAYKWVVQNATAWGGDSRRIALAGESAGGNLAANVAIMARDQNVQRPAHMLLVYPVSGTDMNTPSYQRNAEAIPLNKIAMAWFLNNAIRNEQDLQNPMLDLVGRANLRSLPPATVITAEIDPLMSEGKMLADKLRQAGNRTTYKNFDGVTHEFFGMASVVKDAERAQDLAAQALRDAFKTRVR